MLAKSNNPGTNTSSVQPGTATANGASKEGKSQ